MGGNSKNMAAQVLLYLALLLYFTGCQAWKCAKYEHYFSQQPDYIDCFWDCCGNSFNRHCCAPIGIIVGCGIVGAVVVAALVVLLSCWYHRRRARKQKGPRLFHNRRHSHYPVAPASVTRPAPDQGYKPPGYMPPQAGYRPPPERGYGPPPGRGYGPPSDRAPSEGGPGPDRYNEKPPLDEYRDEKPPLGRAYNEDRFEAPPMRGPPSNRGVPPNRGGPPPSRRRDDVSATDTGSEYSDFEQRGRGPPPRGGYQGGPPRGGHRPAPAPSRPVQPPPKEFIEL